jgi:lipid-A-disaccharide synthase
VPFIYYFPPQVSIWGEWRAKIVSKRARAIIPAFAADAEIYRREGGNVQWFGHPFLDLVKPAEDAAEVMFRHGLDPAKRTMAIMPGSRLQEVETLAEPMVNAARLIKRAHPDLQIILPVAAPHVLPTLEREVRRAEMVDQVTLVSEDVYTLLSKCSVVIVASGTATLEVALLGIPMVIGYRVQPITYHVIKHIIHTRFVGMPNILLNEAVIPELLQGEARAERFAAEALQVLGDPERDRAMRGKLARIRGILGRPEVLARTASFVLREAMGAPRAAVEELV